MDSYWQQMIQFNDLSQSVTYNLGSLTSTFIVTWDDNCSRSAILWLSNWALHLFENMVLLFETIVILFETIVLLFETMVFFLWTISEGLFCLMISWCFGTINCWPDLFSPKKIAKSKILICFFIFVIVFTMFRFVWMNWLETKVIWAIPRWLYTYVYVINRYFQSY